MIQDLQCRFLLESYEKYHIKCFMLRGLNKNLTINSIGGNNFHNKLSKDQLCVDNSKCISK